VAGDSAAVRGEVTGTGLRSVASSPPTSESVPEERRGTDVNETPPVELLARVRESSAITETRFSNRPTGERTRTTGDSHPESSKLGYNPGLRVSTRSLDSTETGIDHLRVGSGASARTTTRMPLDSQYWLSRKQTRVVASPALPLAVGKTAILEPCLERRQASFGADGRRHPNQKSSINRPNSTPEPHLPVRDTLRYSSANSVFTDNIPETWLSLDSAI
jgi:hypothetical protein